MDAELKYIIKSVTEKTGIEPEIIKMSESSLTEWGKETVIKDVPAGKTCFRFSFRGTEYVGFLQGTDGVTANYAHLLSGIIENSGATDISLGFNEYLKKILIGDCPKLQVQKFHVKFNVPDIACYSLVIRCAKGNYEEIMNVLDSYSPSSLDTPLDTDDGNLVYVKFVDTSADAEYQSPGEFAEYLSQSVFEELGVNVSVGVGTVVSHLSDLYLSYQQALTALKMSEIFNSKGLVHTYKEYVLIKMLEDLPRVKLQEYLNVLCGEEGKSVFGDPEMLNTAEEFLENSLNVSETSRKLFMHRNTLIYRLDKIEKATGLNIKNFSDAVTFRLITILGKLLG